MVTVLGDAVWRFRLDHMCRIQDTVLGFCLAQFCRNLVPWLVPVVVLTRLISSIFRCQYWCWHSTSLLWFLGSCNRELYFLWKQTCGSVDANCFHQEEQKNTAVGPGLVEKIFSILDMGLIGLAQTGNRLTPS